MPTVPLTQRAYTLRLDRARGVCKRCNQGNCACWRDALWATHDAVNRGTKAFGDWLLTLRGGLCHTLADAEIPTKDKNTSRSPTDAERRDRRILLALSWLNVEDEQGAPAQCGVRVAIGRDAPKQRGEAVEAALRGILKKRGLSDHEIQPWLRDCGPSLRARIREDAAWINRSACFDNAVASMGPALTREEVWDFLEPFFDTREAYFGGLTNSQKEGDEPTMQDEKSKDLVQKASQWLSSRFGTAKGADFQSITIAYQRIAKWAAAADSGRAGTTTLDDLAAFLKVAPGSDSLKCVLHRISGPGYKSATRNSLKKIATQSSVMQEDLRTLSERAEQDASACEKKTGRKGPRPWADAILKDVQDQCRFTYLPQEGTSRHRQFSVMLDHAARRVSIAHSWIKLAEERRREFESAAGKLIQMQSRAPGAARWLDELCADRSIATGAGAEGGYRIRRRATEGWTSIVKAWSRSSCTTAEDRIAAAREVQADPGVEKFGDIQLFEALAADDALCVWRNPEGTPDDSILIDYVSGKTAEFNRTRFKVPAYRHPDPLRHPVFCDFGNSRWSIDFDCHKAPDPANRHSLQMGLWTGTAVDKVDLHWSSKRLAADLALNDDADAATATVTRADRAGRAASGAAGPVNILNVFEEKKWNGRLQVPREQLNRLAHLQENGQTIRAEKLRQHLGWLVTFSPRFRPSGPFIGYAASRGTTPNRKGEYFPNASANQGRGKLAKLNLSRLPNLRVLSVDLGHRCAAACAVWETVSGTALKTEITGLRILSGSASEDSLHLHVEKPREDGKLRRVIYRRIGPNVLPDKTAHPGPWARLDRQFLIKLQGEDTSARSASPHEMSKVRAWEEALGRLRAEKEDVLPRRVDLLMSETVKMLRRGLRRHGDRARIAFNLTAAKIPTTAGTTQVLDRAGRIELLTKTLLLWHDLFDGRHWTDPWAAAEWSRCGFPKITISGDADISSGQAARARRRKLEDAVRPIAEQLADRDLAEWAKAWTERWKWDDAKWSGREGILRSLKDWITPRGLRPVPADDAAAKERKKAAQAAARHVGGLSLIRINTISSLYQILKAFKMRPEPEDPNKNIPKKDDDELADFNRRLLNTRDQLREQRVKQLASRIVEAALGIGRVAAATPGKTPRRPRRAVDPPCHAVVIESLTHYRPDDLLTRRENRQLMEWSSGKVHKLLQDGCQLNGLYLREVTPNYTSRQCSRTGLPGIRCADVPVPEFLSAPWWRKTVETARKKVKSGGKSAKDLFFSDLIERLQKLEKAGDLLPTTVRVPQPGGEIFVAAPSWNVLRKGENDCPDSRVLHADLNAAANIGIRALLDPDWPGRWWYIPCKVGTSQPDIVRLKGSSAFEGVPELPSDRENKENAKASGEVQNLWCDPSPASLLNGSWKTTPSYWNDVQARAIRLLRRRAGLDLGSSSEVERAAT